MAETKAKSAKTQEPAEKSKQELILEELIKNEHNPIKMNTLIV